MPPGGRGSGEARPFGTVGGDGQDLDRDQRLPAPPRRHPGVPAQHGAAPGSRPRRRLRLHLEARRGGRGGHRSLRRRAALHRGPRPYDDAAADPARHPPGRRPAARTRLHFRLVRRRRPARPDGPRPAPRGRAPAGRHHPRARGRLGAAARLPATAAQDRGGHGHDHLPGGVHPLPDRRRAHPGRGRAHGPTAPRRRREDLPPGLRRGPGPGPARPLRPPRRRLRLPAGAAQGPGHADPGDARDPRAGAGRGAPDRRRRTLRRGPPAARGGDRGAGRRALHRGGALGGTARALRGGRRLRDAVPDPARRPRRGGARHRLPGGVRDRAARGGR